MDYSDIDAGMRKPHQEEEERPLDWAIELVVRLLGLVLLLAGLVAGIWVLLEALSLYRQPEGILPLVTAIEQGSGLDRLLAGNGGTAAANVRLAYFPAWFIAVLLLLVIGQLAVTAVRAGAELLLSDTRLRRMLRALNRR